MAYIVFVLDWAGRAVSDLGDWFKGIWSKITHDPIWGGVTIGVVVLLVVLLILRARLART
jgi:high-affinity Fe2+/Pb2+ permease